MFPEVPSRSFSLKLFADLIEGVYSRQAKKRIPDKFTQQQARFSPSRLAERVDLAAFHERQIDHHGTVMGRTATEAMSTPIHRHLEVLLAGKGDGAHDISHVRTANDHGWVAINHAIPHAPCVVVCFVSWTDEQSMEMGLQGVENVFVDSNVQYGFASSGV